MEGGELTGLISTHNSQMLLLKFKHRSPSRVFQDRLSFQLLQVTISLKTELIERIIAQPN